MNAPVSPHPPRLETFLRSLGLRDSTLVLHLLRCRTCGRFATQFLGVAAQGEPPLRRDGVVLSEIPDYRRIWPGLEAILHLEAERVADEREDALKHERDLFALPEAERTQAVHREPRFRTLALGLALLEHSPSPAIGERIERACLAIAIADLLVERQGSHATRAALRSAAGLALAEALREQGNLVQAEIELKAVATCLEASGDALDRARYARALGLLRRDQQSPEEAFALLDRAAMLFGEIGETRRQVGTLLALGELHLDLADSRAAFAAFDAALAVLERDEEGGASLLVRAAQGAALALVLLERGEEAIDTLSTVASRVANPKDSLRLRDLQARIEISRLRFSRAVSFLREIPAAWMAESEPIAAAQSAVFLAQALLEEATSSDESSDSSATFADLVEILERLTDEPLFPIEVKADLWSLSEALVDRRRPPQLLRQIAEALDRLRALPETTEDPLDSQEPS